jgi:hypothetical protein
MQLIRGKKLKQIFSDHWEGFVENHQGQIRPAIHKNVAKMLICGTEEAGFHLYQCPSCGKEKKVPHTCKSRFCPSCGVGQTERWIEQYTTLFANTVYRHIIFHPPSEFRPYFGLGKTVYYDMLYATVNQTLKDWYSRKGFIPGCMSVMHTFGRDTKFTPHIHALMTSGGIDKTLTRWVACDYLPYPFFKKHFRDHFLENIQKLWIHQNLEKIPLKLRFLFTGEYQQKIIHRLLAITWYVYIGEKLINAQFTVRYIGRYTKRPAIAESRIIAYDGETVTFNFVDHKTDKLTYHTLPAQEFIGKLIRHIPSENFRIIRYSGFYANRVRSTLLPKVFAILNQDYEKAKEKLAHLGSWWRTQIERFTKLDPLVCTVCLLPLALISIVYTTNKAERDTYG